MPLPGGKQASALASHIATGAFGEEEALRYLSRLGFRLEARNWRPAEGGGKIELDLVCRWEKTLFSWR